MTSSDHSDAKAHVVQVDRRLNCASATLAPAALQRLEAALRASTWYRGRWSRREFRQTVMDILRSDAAGGLAVVSPRLGIEAPAPFVEFFEPIELGAGDAQLKTLSGDAPTRQERVHRWLLLVLAAAGLGVLGPFFVVLLFGGAYRIVMTIVLLLAANGAIIFVAAALTSVLETWFLLPGAVAVRRNRGRPQDRLTLLTRYDTFALLRHVAAGKAVILALELWSADGRKRRRAVSDREAISFLAAWQSPLPPPTREQLAELAG
jgi:hypothetical protein